MNTSFINRTSINGNLRPSVVVELGAVRDFMQGISVAFSLFGFYDDDSPNKPRRMYKDKELRAAVLSQEAREMIVSEESRQMEVTAQGSLAAASENTAFEPAAEGRVMIVPEESRSMVSQ